MERMRYIRVPKDIKAMEDYEYGVQKDEQMEELILSESQYSVFYSLKVFHLINEECDVIIDDYEEEVLSLEKIPLALKIVNKIIQNYDDINLLKFKNMLELAIKYKTIVGFDF